MHECIKQVNISSGLKTKGKCLILPRRRVFCMDAKIGAKLYELMKATVSTANQEEQKKKEEESHSRVGR